MNLSLLGFSISRLLRASGRLWEDDRPETAICVLRCQSGGVNVIVTDRAVWCVRNFTPNAMKSTSKPFVSLYFLKKTIF